MSDETAESGGTRWVCRNCGGGFPDPIKQSGRWKCPWCSEPIAKWAGDYGTREIGRLVRADR